LKVVRTIVILLLLIILQSTVVDLIAIRGIKPDLVLIFFLLYFAGSGGVKSILAGFGLGLLQDLAGGGFLGVNCLAKSVAGFTLSKLFPQKIPEEKWLFVSGLLVCILLHDLVIHYIYNQGKYSGFFNLLIGTVLPFAAYNYLGILLVMLLPVKRKWWRRDELAR
jgi:rod shape-determining protein MreD